MKMSARNKAIRWMSSQAAKIADTIFPVFQHNGWTWLASDIDRVPTHKELVEEIKRLLGQLKRHKEMSMVSCGRITIRLEKEGNVYGIHAELDLESHYAY